MKLLLALLLLVLAPSASQAQNAWSYVGIPYTDWPYDPFTYGPPATPPSWPSAATAGTYYMEPAHPSATDAVAGGEPVDAFGKRYGYPNRPRLTLPLQSKNLNTYPAGVVFWLKGGDYNTTLGTGEQWILHSPSTSSAPFRIYGDPANPPVFRNARIIMPNCSYGFVDNIIWEKGSKGSSCIGFVNPLKAGDTHHIAVRNCQINNRDFVSNSAFFEMSARSPSETQGNIHDIVSYRNSFHACGYGVSWDEGDADMHGYKINGKWDWTYPDGVPTVGLRNRVYRIWIIQGSVTPGAEPDPLDGYKKGMAGSFVQIGDQKISEGDTDHVYVAGNYIEGIRQSTVGHKRCADCVSSSNITKRVVMTATAQGQSYNFKYDRQDNLWVVNNYVEDSPAFIIRAETTAGYGVNLDTFPKEDTRVHIVGNIFKNCMLLPFEAPDSGGIGGRKSKGICIQDMNGKVYVMNNLVDTSPYGVFYGTSGTRQSEGSEMHTYNNVFLNISPGADTSTAAGNGICVITAPLSKFYSENNFTDNGRNYFAGTQYTTDSGFNARDDASGNLSGDPLFTDAENEDYTLQAGSPLIDAGITSTTAAPDSPITLYNLFTEAFADDPDFPGSPADVWPRDYAGAARQHGSAIDIGPYEYGSAAPEGSAPSNIVAPSIVGEPMESQELTLALGSWSGVPAPSYAVQWIRCNASGGSPADIAGETSPTYTLVTADIGGTIRARVTATNSEGSSTVTSAQTAVITSFLAPSPAGSATATSITASSLTIEP